MAVCPAFDPLGPYVSNVLAYVDCRAITFAEAGYRALGPGSAYGLAFTGLLTIFVALIGYRLLLGNPIGMRDGAGVALRLGVVLVLTTQWPAYRTLVVDPFTQAPEELAAGMLAPAGLGQGSSGLAARIDGAGAALADLINTPSPQLAPTQAQAPVAGQPAPPPTNSGTNSGHVLPQLAAKSVDDAAGIVVASALAGLVSVRVVLALMLALGPIFITFLLFDATRGLFVGWARVVLGAALAGLAVPVALAVELSILEPQVLALRALFDGNQPLGLLPEAILATAVIFAAVVLALLLGAVWAAAGLHWPVALGRDRLETMQQSWSQPQNLLQPQSETMAANTSRSRAQSIADAAMASVRRESLGTQTQARVLQLAQPRNLAQTARRQDSAIAAAPQALGQAWRRSTPRSSLSANRRDRL